MSEALRPARNDAVDLLRGAVMVLMALDHARDFFADGAVRPTDLAHASAALFLTRWVTHFCAPVFVLLAGTGARLSLGRGRDTNALARFLVTRGLWLVLLELTVVHLGWEFELSYRFTMLQVIWAIGWSMVILAGLLRVPLMELAAVGAVLVAGHNLLDEFHADALGPAARALWSVLHEPHGFTWLPGRRLYVAYPVLPWAGVMALGYALGAWLTRPALLRRRGLWSAGLAAIVLFLVLRGTRSYGDPAPWTAQRSALFTALSWLNCTKYPPSLQYLLMTLGPALCALAALDGRAPRWGRPLLVFGRVPLFYYIAHLYVIHGAAAVFARASAFRGHATDGPLLRLPGVYAVWLAVVLVLYLPCRWFAGIKQRRRDPWLSFL